MPDIAFTSLNLTAIQQGWQEDLGAFLHLSVQSPSQIQESFQAGEYQILLMPFTPASDDVAALFGAFASDSRPNYFGYQNVVFDDLLRSAEVQPTARLAVEKYAQAESLLLSDGVVVPLFFETSYLALGNETSDLVYSPLGDQVFFKYARRED
jgi:oligopeptide transport system substrate-binding protein